VAHAKHLTVLIALLLLSACTPGGIAATGGGGGSGGTPSIVDVSLSAFPATSIPAGMAGGFSPVVSTLAVGSSVRFVNTDSFAHTATAIPNATTFPSGSPFNSSATTASGSAISGAWSAGALQAGQTSQTFTIDRAGTYLYGCFFHYGAPMRGEIVAL
jgi:plastocyanin